MTSATGESKRSLFFYPSCNLRRDKTSAFTLIEIVLALMILSLLLALSIPSLGNYLEEQRLHSSMNQLSTFIQEGRHLALTTQHPHRIHFTDKSIELYDDSLSKKESPEPLRREIWFAGVQIREKTEETPAQYLLPEDWILSPQGLCAPLRFRFTLEKSWMEFSIHPLDGSFQNLEFKIE